MVMVLCGGDVTWWYSVVVVLCSVDVMVVIYCGGDVVVVRLCEVV